MAEQHPVFKAPDNLDIRIWRYMAFTKFVSMLEDEALFFCRADCFDDPFEGSYPRANEKLRPVLYKDLGPEVLKNTTQSLSEFSRWQRQWILINCWHMNEHESAAMWKLYAKTNEAICIQSSYSRLRQCLDEEVYIGEVQYIDYEAEWMPEGNALYPFMYKRKSFEHECELRAVTCKWPTRDKGFDYSAAPPEGGTLKKVDLAQLIEVIYVAPTSPSWFHWLVKKVVVRYGHNKPVIQSSLDDKPFY